MGVYLSTPNTEKNSSDQLCKRYSYGASSMQGWRMSQEDAHNCIPEFEENTALFAVYDGHGGAEVAQYCATNLPQFIKESSNYKDGKFTEALEEAFLAFDALLITPTVIKELKILAGVESDEEDTPAKKRSEAELLRQEAEMPIEELMEKYETSESTQPRPRILRKKIQVNSPVIKLKNLPFPRDGDKDMIDSNSESKLDEKITNGHAENENNINLEKESQMSSSLSSSVQQDTISSSADNSSKLSSQSTISNSSEGSSSSEHGSSSAASKSDISMVNQKTEASSTSTDAGGISSSSEASSSVTSGSSSHSKPKGSTLNHPEGSGVSSSDSKLLRESCKEGTKEKESSNEVSQGGSSKVSDTDIQEGATSTNQDDTAGSSSGVKSKEEEEEDEDYDEEEDEDFSGSEDEDVEFDSEEEAEESEEEEEMDEIDSVTIEEEPHSEEPGSDSGTTAVVALIKDKKIFVANAGDSRCILSRAGKAVDLSFDHKPEDDIERNRIQAAGGKVTEEGRVNGGLNMSRAIGDHFYKRNTSKSAQEQMITALPDIEIADIQEDDEFLVLACDGIWNSLTSQEVVDFVKEKMKEENHKKQLSLICEQLFDRCLAPNTLGDGTGCDNMTCIIVTFDQLLNNNKNKRPADDTEDVSDKRRKVEELGT